MKPRNQKNKIKSFMVRIITYIQKVPNGLITYAGQEHNTQSNTATKKKKTLKFMGENTVNQFSSLKWF